MRSRLIPRILYIGATELTNVEGGRSYSTTGSLPRACRCTHLDDTACNCNSTERRARSWVKPRLLLIYRPLSCSARKHTAVTWVSLTYVGMVGAILRTTRSMFITFLSLSMYASGPFSLYLQAISTQRRAS